MKYSRMFLLVLSLEIILLVNNCIGQFDWQCVSPCKCIWVSGKKTAECKQQNITNIPNFLSREIQHLDLSGNNIQNIPNKIFTRVKLDNLQKLVLHKCNINTIDSESFNGLRIIIEIDLSENLIEYLHRDTFVETERLRVLILNQNRLQKLEDNLFHDMIFLQKIELTDNRLVQIGKKTFWNLPGLQTLTLNGNNLTKLHVESFHNLPKLSSLELRNNPWNCDCYLKPFRDWTIQHKLYTKPTSCKQPLRLMNKMWDEVSDDEFACIPIIDNIGFVSGNSIGTNVYLWCKASAKPKPQIMWVHRQWILTNGTKRHIGDKNYIILQTDDWSNLTISNALLSDKGEYVCRATNFGGIVEKNISLILDEIDTETNKMIGLPLTIGLSILACLVLLVTFPFCMCYYRRKNLYKKNIETTSLDHHGLNEQKSLITAINPIVKPPRRCEAPSITSHGTELTEINRILLDNDSIFTETVGNVVGVLNNVVTNEEGAHPIVEYDSTLAESGLSNIDTSYAGSIVSGIGNISCNTTLYRQYPPDLLAFSGRQDSSPTSQTSEQPENYKLSSYIEPLNFSSSTTYSPVGFKTLPHPIRASSATPYSSNYLHPSLTRHGYVTIPRRPRAPSWSNGPLKPQIERDIIEPIYDNLGRRTTADGSSVPSLNKTPEPRLSMRDRPLPATPNSLSCSYSQHSLSLLRQPLNTSINRSPPEGAVHRLHKYINEQQKQKRPKNDSDNKYSSPILFKTKLLASGHSSNTLKKVPPIPPPKPKKKNENGPLYEDEDEDGTEV